MFHEPRVGDPEVNKLNITASDVVYGHRACQTCEVKWLCLDSIYQKLYRPNYYDIGGTYRQHEADYWFSYKTEQVGNIFLLHLFICNHAESTFNIALSCGNELEFDKKTDNDKVFLKNSPTLFKFKQMTGLSHTYITTYSFTELDIECLKNKKLYIAASFPVVAAEEESNPVIDNIKLNHDCIALLTDPVYSDFVIESADKVKFHVHKLILRAYSDVFKAMLKEDTAESQNNYVKLIDVSGEDLKYMLEFFYTGSVKDVENMNFASLLMLADRYNLKGLCQLSEYALMTQMTEDNAIDLLIMGDMYDSDITKSEAFKFIKENKELLRNSLFDLITNHKLLKQLCTYITE